MAGKMPTSPSSARPGPRHDLSPHSPESRPEYNPSSFGPSPGAMPLTIRNASMNVNLAPPPLPPPRDIPPQTISRHQARAFHSAPHAHNVALNSSLTGGWKRPYLAVSNVPRKPGLSLSKHPIPEGEALTSSKEDDTEVLPSLTAQIQEPRPLGDNPQRSAHDYDQQQLSKLGRPRTPVKSSARDSVENSPLAPGLLRLDTQASFNKLTLADRSIGSDSPYKTSSPFTRWNPSLQSGALSPGLPSSASSRSQSMGEWRSPTYEPSTAPSSVIAEQSIFSRSGSIDRSSNAGLSLLSSAFDDTDRDLKPRSGHVMRDRPPPDSGMGFSRASMDHGIFSGDADMDSDFAARPNVARRYQMEVSDDAMQRYSNIENPMAELPFATHHGVKRKASPTHSTTNENLFDSVRNHAPARSVKRTSPSHQPTGIQASFNPSSRTGLQSSLAPVNQSLASSNSPAFRTDDQVKETRVDRQLPKLAHGSHSEQVYSREGPCEMFSQPDVSSPLSSGVSTQSPQSLLAHHDSVNSRLAGKPAPPFVKPLLANIHMCNCCPKKPKKFSTLEALQAHQNEKQYYCEYCKNRFKNKNEAERHKNSLHLRKQSWSCAALENRYEKAFHPITAPLPGVGPALRPGEDLAAESDVCGYCGQQFPNCPAPDWVERSKHLTERHKFGECNQTKKFFRADHFRQHLKHSHGGLPGKWTNMLEAACLRDEPLPLETEKQPQEQPQHHYSEQNQDQQQQQNQMQATQALQAVQQQQQSSLSQISISPHHARNIQ